MRKLAVVALLAGTMAASAQADGALSVVDAWIMTPPAGAPTAAAYLRIANASDAPDRLLAVTSPRAGEVEMHDMSMNGAVMQMRPLRYGVTVPARGAYAFTPSSAHIMLMNVERPLASGESVPLRLTFQHAGVVEVTARVQPIGAAR